MKSGLGRITENTEQYQGVIVYNMSDIPLVSTRFSNIWILLVEVVVGSVKSELGVTVLTLDSKQEYDSRIGIHNEALERNYA